MTYSSLHNHTYFSALDGYSSPKEYLEKAVALGLKAFAITEHGNAYSWIYFDEIKKEYPDVKVMYGVEFYEALDANIKDKDNKYFHLVAIAMNEVGRIALNELVTKSNFEGFYYKPRISIQDMKPYAENLVITSGCLASKLSREQDYNKCVEYIKEYKSIFPHFYLEMQSHVHIDQVTYNQKLLKLAKETNTPFVITTDSHVANKEDLKYQAKLVQIARDDDTLEEIYEGCYLQSSEEIHAIMDKQIGNEAVTIGLDYTNSISDIIGVVDMPFQEAVLPHYPLPEGFETSKKYLQHLVNEGWKNSSLTFEEEDKLHDYSNRAHYELEIINDMGFAGYFIIVWDMINWAKENDVMVGAGRGSAGGSLVCYLLGITDLDPIQYDLIFERFLNPERVSMPDIDIDFGDRDKVIQYLTDKYGEDSVCQIINYSYITPKVAIKDTARILGVPYAVSEKVSKRFDYDTFEEAMKNNPGIEDDFPQHSNLFEIAGKLSGRLRNVSTHAGGVGIVDTQINDYMPMRLGTKGEHVIQADKKKSEDIGIIKFDILGISTLTMMQEILTNADVDLQEINPNNESFLTNEKMWEVLRDAKTNGVFQVESQGMKELLLRLNPSSLEDISAILALYRPDSMEMLEDYIHYKDNPEEIELWHDDMADIVSNTHGCIIYQEQLMNIVRRFGGRSMGGADKFRKAIGKKDLDLVKSEAKKLYQEIVDNGYSEELAKKISEYMETKGGYMFNRSHSALYSVLTLQTAYLKANYTVEFFTALLNQNKSDYGSLNKYIVDAIGFDIVVNPPDINKSEEGFTIHDGEIVFGINGIKGIGGTLSSKIIEERTNGKFKNLDDFKERVSPSVAQIVALVKSGAIKTSDKMKYLKKYAKKTSKKREFKPVKTLPSKKILAEKWDVVFDVDLPKEKKLKAYNILKEKKFNKEQKEKLEKHMRVFEEKYLLNEGIWEFETLSVFISGNPFHESKRYIASYHEAMPKDKCIVVGIISDVTKRKDRHKKQFAFASLYTSLDEIIDITFWHSQFNEYQDSIKRGKKIAVKCRKLDGDRYVVEKMKDYDFWLSQRKSD